MISLMDRLRASRKFDGLKLMEEMKSEGYDFSLYDDIDVHEGAKAQYLKDTPLFDLLCEVAVAVKGGVLYDCGCDLNKPCEIHGALAALEAALPERGPE